MAKQSPGIGLTIAYGAIFRYLRGSLKINPYTMKYLLPCLAAGLLLSASSCGDSGFKAENVDRPFIPEATEGAGLRPLALEKLPVGAIKAEGWVLRQLESQRDGLNGHLSEISAWLDRENNAWLVEGGDRGWEEVPYWLRGYSHLAYLLNDPEMIKVSQFWIEAVLASQKENGYFGPLNLRNGKPEVWAQMIMLWTLQNYYEFTSDERVLPFMKKYFEWEMAQPDEDFLEDYWENCRGGDNMWSVIWYYGQTGDASVLPLIEKIHRNNADCANPARLPNWHNVNIAQYFREPAEMYLRNGDSTMLTATYNVHDLIRRTYGQVPGGMFGADENARIGYIDPRQGTETCGFAEQLLSDGVMLGITADPLWAENMEDVAFNSFPASMMPDLTALRYITSPNHTVSDSKNHHPGIDNRGPFLNMNPFSSRCCQHNHGLGWPSFTQALAFATNDNGVAYAVYAPSEATVNVDGKKVTIAEKTNYPFDETITFRVSAEDEVSFPMYFRIPSWAKGAKVYVNGKAVGSPEAGSYLRVEGEWSNADEVKLVFPMELSLRRWPTNQNSASVNYGPLTLSLKIDERYVKVNSAEMAIGDSRWQKGADPEKWPTYEIYADSPWNYSLILPETDPFAAFKVTRRPWPADNQPFTVDNAPLEVKATGRLVPSWGLDETGLTGVLPRQDAPRSAEIDEITLVPMGAARLRVSAFPTSEE